MSEVISVFNQLKGTAMSIYVFFFTGSLEKKPVVLRLVVLERNEQEGRDGDFYTNWRPPLH